VAARIDRSDEPVGAGRGSNRIVTAIRTAAPEADRRASVRLRQGLALLLGAVVFAAVVGPDPDRFYLTPLGLGLVYLAAAVVGGRRGGYWATAIVLLAWGAAVVWLRQGRPDLDTAGVYMTAVGCRRRGRHAARAPRDRGRRARTRRNDDPRRPRAGLRPQWDILVEARAYALLVGVVGLVNAVWSAVAGRAAEA
jgi:hypothetical protein